MFQIQKPESIKWPVTVNIPRDGGNTTKATFTADFKLISQDEFSAIYRDGGNDEDLLRSVVVGLGKDVSGEDGKPMAFNAENLDKLIAIPYVRSAMTTAYLECSSGKTAARKNS